MDNPNDPPLDEIQWHSPQIIQQMGGLHSNTILFYFAESPFFERTSNNAVIMSQAMNNMSMYHFIQTREAFEGRLKTMSGLEFIVGEEPAETGPGMGTGVWVIRKQTRRKRFQEADEITIHASYFVVNENIYMAPTLADILAARIMSISSSISKALPAAESARSWRPAGGHYYKPPRAQASGPAGALHAARARIQESKEATPTPTGSSGGGGANKGTSTTAPPNLEVQSLERVAEEAFWVHMRYGGEYIDENPITGRPGDFHLSSTGRKPVTAPRSVAAGQLGPAGISAMTGPPVRGGKADDKKDGGVASAAAKGDKAARSAMPKPKRKKSKLGGTGSRTPTAA
ncbi:Mediator complex, subunit Med6 [Cordyceps fumosorosea ARSEF 2679]|uniref:Mediator of RNA polymerase II transcription subunit 6 n=1 Tax=Cordyceps fumosorosea (strain ARSEF 2679) TaxID=1081104 RepID=A0A167ZLZ8_CORFA|nr:Mediator complex, subunit Med6 [Cordyceps fumosorosea ARSEF 2679]OAA67676.1 Mediator complex, subunit Med6 [Cordyceps fumosorosea ARSEF 2679]